MDRRRSREPAARAEPTSRVDDVLRAPGQPLDAATRAFMETRFGHDFSQVRVHADAGAAEAARSAHALAYTVGRQVVFGAGRYAPATAAGRRLLGHELAHVVQQDGQDRSSVSGTAAEAEAERAGELTAAGGRPTIAARVPAGTVQHQKDKNPLDAKAQAIIDKAADSKLKEEERAVAVVTMIIDEYYPADKSKVDSVKFDDAKAGGGVHVFEKMSADNKKENSTGILYVGKSFLSGVTARHFARRVLQVGHELEHITQWRTGLAGGHKGDEREFLAFSHEALNPEKPGTGRMQHATRVALIDGALGYYYCLDADKQKQYASNQKDLLDRRSGAVKASGQAATEAPSTCKRQ